MQNVCKKSIPLFGVVHTPEMELVALEVLRSGRIASGEYVPMFERGLGQLLKHAHVVTTADMTGAIQIALRLAGVGPGDDVLTSAFACMSTNAAIAAMGARPVWVDMKLGSAHIDVGDFENAITPKTRAAILYHLSGYPGPCGEIAGICSERRIRLIEDCDNALLALLEGRPVGTFGDFAIYSFYPNRQINTTEGGALACRVAEDAVRARKLRRFGIDGASFRDSSGEINANSDIPEAGWAASLNNFCSAVGNVQLGSVAVRVEKSRANARALRARLDGRKGLEFVEPFPGADPSFWTLLAEVDFRDSVLAILKSKGVMASKLHLRNDQYSCFGKSLRPLPNTERFQQRVLALPCGWWLEPDDIEYIVSAVDLALRESQQS